MHDAPPYLSITTLLYQVVSRRTAGSKSHTPYRRGGQQTPCSTFPDKVCRVPALQLRQEVPVRNSSRAAHPGTAIYQIRFRSFNQAKVMIFTVVVL